MRKLLSLLVILIAMPAWCQLSTVTVSTAPSYQIPNNFLGLSLEWDNSTYGNAGQALMGTTATGIDTIFRQLVTNLALTAPIPFRIGGNSANMFTSPDDVTAFAQWNVAMGSPFWLSVNQKTATVSQSVAQASSYMSNMPVGSILGFEVGNEPDAYSPQWSEATYDASLSAIISAVKTSLPGTKFMYPSCGGAYNCLAKFGSPESLYFEHSADTQANSIHYYATDASTNPTSGYLLSSSAYYQLPIYQMTIASAHRAGNVIRVGEMNSISGGGTSGVSNAFESALWMLDTLLRFASYGGDGANVHSNWMGGAYAPATITITAGTPNTFTLTQVWPEYYGMQAFQEVLGSGNAKIYTTTVTAGTSSSVDAFDLIDSSGAERAVVINRDTTNSGNVNFTPTKSYTNATCYTLTAPSYSSTTGVTIHGQTYDGSTDGRILGTYTTSTITPSSGVYSIPLAVAQAQICKFN